MRRLLKILRNTLIILILLLFSAYGMLHLSSVQTWLARRTAQYLSEQLGTEVRVGGVDIDLWTRIVLEDVFVADQHGDTLVFLPAVHVGSHSLDRKQKKLAISSVQLDNPVFRINRSSADSLMNYAFLIDYFKGGDTTDTSGGYTFSLDELVIRNGRFSYTNELRSVRTRYGIDWNRLIVSHLDMKVLDLLSDGDSVQAEVRQLAAIEKSGFELKNLSGFVRAVPGATDLSQADIETNNSHIHGQLSFEFDSMDDLNHFEEQVRMKHEFDKSSLQLGDLAWFVPEFKGLDRTIEISGKFRGKIDNLKGKNIYVKWDDHSWFRGNIALDGLPDLSHTFIQLEVEELTSNKAEIEQIPLPPFDSVPTIHVHTPENFAHLGQMSFSGNFTGFYNNFTSYGELQTDIGRLRSDISLKDTLEDSFAYTGRIRPMEFDLGKFYGTRDLGAITADLEVSGTGLTMQSVDADIRGQIADMKFREYSYRDIAVGGNYRKNYFKGHLEILDPNVSMVFDGSVDFTHPKPELNFIADVANLDLKKLNLFTSSSYSAFSGLIRVKSEGLEIENFSGDISLSDVTYCSRDQEYQINHVAVQSKFLPDGSRTITLDSPIASGFIRGLFKFNALEPSFADVIDQIIPAYNPIVKPHLPQSFTMHLDILDATDFCRVFAPDIQVSNGTRLDLLMDEVNRDFTINLFGDSLTFKGNKIANYVVDVRRPEKDLFFNLVSESCHLGGLNLTDFALSAFTQNDTVFTDISLGNDSTSLGAMINGKFVVRGNQNFDIQLSPNSTISLNQVPWTFDQEAYLRIDSTRVEANHLEVYNNNQLIKLDGVISESSRLKMNVDIEALDLSQFNFLIAKNHTTLNGIVSGNAAVRDFYGDRIFTSDLTLIDFILNHYPIGDLCLESTWDNTNRWLQLDGELERDKITPLKFNGYYRPGEKENPLDLLVKARDFDLAFINGFLTPGAIELTGKVSGDIVLRGSPDYPKLSGIMESKGVSVYVPYLNTRYFVHEPFEITPDAFVFPHIRCTDEEGHSAYVTGAILHHAFGQWNFDINVEAEGEKFLCLNTGESEQALYYGKAYATGYASIFGYASNLEFDINLKSQPGSSFALPIGNTEEVTFENFVRFVDADHPEPLDDVMDLSGIQLNMNLEITPDIDFEIIFDKAVGDVMKGKGKGNLNMTINPYGEFTMYGLVEVVKGNYLFTLKNLVNKEFLIRPGGTLAWYGDPFQADIHLDAVYKLTAALYDLMPEDNAVFKQRVPVDVAMNLSGNLFNPGIDFAIELPTVDELTRSRVNSAISTDQEKNRQAFALLVMRRFVSPPNVTRQHTTDFGITEHGSELLTNQLNNWLSQISDEFNLGFNYRPGDEISNEEIALALSTQLFNDRLLLSGNFGVSRGNEANQNASSVIGDIRVEYRLTEEGKIHLVVYNDSNDFDPASANQSIYTQGVGILYQEEFDTLDEFFCSFGNLFRTKPKRTGC